MPSAVPVTPGSRDKQQPGHGCAQPPTGHHDPATEGPTAEAPARHITGKSGRRQLPDRQERQARRIGREAQFWDPYSTNRCTTSGYGRACSATPSSDSAAAPGQQAWPGPGLSFGLTAVHSGSRATAGRLAALVRNAGGRWWTVVRRTRKRVKAQVFRGFKSHLHLDGHRPPAHQRRRLGPDRKRARSRPRLQAPAELRIQPRLGIPHRPSWLG
jgi:hypothetical protein